MIMYTYIVLKRTDGLARCHRTAIGQAGAFCVAPPELTGLVTSANRKSQCALLD